MANNAQPERIDYFDPAIVMAFVAAAIADFASLFWFGAMIPTVGFVIIAYIILSHLFAILLIGALIVPKLKHLLPKLTFGLGALLSLLGFPTLVLSLGIAIVMQSQLVEFAISQAAILAIGAVTEGTGAVVGEAALAAKTTEGAAEVGEAGIAAARGTGAAGRGAQAARGAAEAEGSAETLATGRLATEDVYQTPEAQLEEGLFEKTPETPTQPAEEPAQTQPGGEQPEVGEKSEEELTRGQRAGRYAQEKIREIRDRDLGIDTRPEEEPEGAIDDETIDLREAA